MNTYKQEVERLQQIRNLYPELSSNTNSIVNNLNVIYKQNLKGIISEYSYFSTEAIHMLLLAQIKTYEWEGLQKEIKENIEEEMGAFTNNVPHLEMMRKGYLEELDIDCNEYRKKVTPITIMFVDKMKKLFTNFSNASIAGALLAFEGTAIMEFHTFQKIIEKYLGKKLDMSTTIGQYILGHQKFEIEHEQHLIDSIAPYIHPNNMEEMSTSYIVVCELMEKWWNMLYTEFKS